MPDSPLRSREETLALARAAQLRGWLRGERPALEGLLGGEAGLAEDRNAVVELVHAEAVLRQASGEAPTAEEYARRFSASAEAIRARFALDPGLRQPDEGTTGPFTDPNQTTPAAVYTASEEAGEWPEVAGYQILDELGRGGMGVVYKARQLKPNRVVALKMLLAGAHAGAEELQRFCQEAEAIARLQHPNIVQVFEVGEHAGTPYFSLEFCGGGSLADRLGEPLAAPEAAALIEALARAVEAAHQQGVIHRDLKPGNVLLAAPIQGPIGREGTEHDALPDGRAWEGGRALDGIPKVADFGLAKLIAEGEVGTRQQTQTGAILGTPSYMAPEQAGGLSRQISPATDVYALGAILYECLTGRPPFLANNALDTLLLVLEQEPVPPRQLNPKVPRDLETIALKCLQKDLRHRYASAAELADDLRRFRDEEPIRARPPGPVRRVDRWVRKHQGLVMVWGAVLLLLVVLARAIDPEFVLAPGLRRRTGWEALWLLLPTMLAVLAATARGHGGASLLALAGAGPGAWGLWRWTGAGGVEPFAAALSWSAGAGLAALVAGLWWARGWRETLLWLTLVGAAAPLLGVERFLLIAAHGLLVGGFVWLVRWALGRQAGTIALGGLVGALAGLVLGEGDFGDQFYRALQTSGLRGVPRQGVCLYLEACVVFAGAVVGGILGLRRPAQGLPGGDQVVPSQKRTSSR